MNRPLLILDGEEPEVVILFAGERVRPCMEVRRLLLALESPPDDWSVVSPPLLVRLAPPRRVFSWLAVVLCPSSPSDESEESPVNGIERI